MWFPDLTRTGVNRDTAFVALAWAELFGDRTPDTYQIKLNDTLSLVVELGEVAEQAAADQRWVGHLPYVIDELKAEADADPILNSHFPHLSYAINQLDRGASHARVRRLVAVSHSELHEYGPRVADYFRESIRLLPREKERALDAIRRLATRSLQQGSTPDECRRCVDESSLLLSPDEAGQQILDRLVERQQPWVCIIGVAGDPADVETLINGTGFKPLPNKRKPLGKLGTEFIEKAGGGFLAVCDLEASGYAEAMQKALQPLRTVLDVANFNHRSAPFRIIPTAYLESEGNQYVVALDSHPYGGLEPQRNATRSAARAQRDGALSRLPDRILTALEQHSLAHTSSDPKVRFVNLWVALETLIGHARGESVIDHMVSSVVPLIIHRRLHKVITYLAISLHEFGFCNSVPDTTGWFRNSNSYEVKREELLLALTGAAGARVHDELAALTATHPLLCNRLFTAHKAVATPASLAQALRASEKRTEWQLRRIYRARNLLVHAGVSLPVLPHLMANLEYYYSLILARLLHDFYRNESWTITKSFEYRRIMFGFLLRLLDGEPAKVKVKDVLQLNSGPLGEEPLWP
jgi:hypothetical protein